MASAEEAGDKKAAFLGELAKVEAYLAQHGPFFGGDKLDATDASMAPKMYHALTALGEAEHRGGGKPVVLDSGH
jgi:hypothetical protein